MQARGREIDIFGLAYQDILEYLHIDALRTEFPEFPPWQLLKRQRGKVKDAATRAAGQPVNVATIRRIAEAMFEMGAKPPAELAQCIDRIIETAHRQ